MSPAALKMEVKGLEQLQARFRNTSKAMQETVDGHRRATAGAIMQEAQRTVPVVTGQLRSSAYVRDQGKVTTYGYDAPHAIFVHEIPFSGKTTKGLPGALRNGQGYKWLLRATRKMGRNAKNLLRAAISETLATAKSVKFNVPAIDAAGGRGGKAGFASKIGTRGGKGGGNVNLADLLKKLGGGA